MYITRWADQCEARLVEAEWRLEGSNPLSLDEYLNTAAISVAGLIVLVWCFMATVPDTLIPETLLDHVKGSKNPEDRVLFLHDSPTGQ